MSRTSVRLSLLGLLAVAAAMVAVRAGLAAANDGAPPIPRASEPVIEDLGEVEVPFERPIWRGNEGVHGTDEQLASAAEDQNNDNQQHGATNLHDVALLARTHDEPSDDKQGDDEQADVDQQGDVDEHGDDEQADVDQQGDVDEHGDDEQVEDRQGEVDEGDDRQVEDRQGEVDEGDDRQGDDQQGVDR